MLDLHENSPSDKVQYIYQPSVEIKWIDSLTETGSFKMLRLKL